jgi:mRNA interferase RelE/StbE
VPDALKEWQALDGSIKEPLRKALKKRLEHPHMPGAELHGDLLVVTRSNVLFGVF